MVIGPASLKMSTSQNVCSMALSSLARNARSRDGAVDAICYFADQAAASAIGYNAMQWDVARRNVLIVQRTLNVGGARKNTIDAVHGSMWFIGSDSTDDVTLFEFDFSW